MKKAVECLCVVASAVDSRLMVYWRLGGGSWRKGLVLGQGFASLPVNPSQQKEHALEVGIWGSGEERGAVPPALQHPHCLGGSSGSAPQGLIQHLLPGERRTAKEARPVCSSSSDPAASITPGMLSPPALLSTSRLLPSLFCGLSHLQGDGAVPWTPRAPRLASGGWRCSNSMLELLRLSLRVTKLLSVKK